MPINNGGTRSTTSAGPGGTGPSMATGRGGTRPSTECLGGTPSTASESDSGRDGTRPSKRRPVHWPVVESFNRSIIVFVTVCTKDRQPVLANDKMHDLLVRAWSVADAWKVGRYVIMPDHIHLFCAPGTWPPTGLRRWVGYWKSLVARGWVGHGPLAVHGGTPSTPSVGGTPSTASAGPGGTGPSMHPEGRGGTRPSTLLWQRDFWDTQLRRRESYSAKWKYVRDNPVRAGLVAAPELWPYQGELSLLPWHD